MGSHAWRSLEKPLNEKVLSVIENEFKFEKMTPVQVTIKIFFRKSNEIEQKSFKFNF